MLRKIFKSNQEKYILKGSGSITIASVMENIVLSQISSSDKKYRFGR